MNLNPLTLSRQDEEDIIAVMRRYLHAADARDGAALGSCFSLDAHAVFNEGTPGRYEDRGRASIQARAMQVVSNFESSCHGMANCVARLVGPDQAELDTFVSAHILKAGVVASRGLRYQDKLVRKDGRWEIVQRVHTPLWQFDSPAVASAIPGLAQMDAART